MRNPFKPRQAPAQSWARRSSVLSADDPVFKDVDESERKSIEASTVKQQQKSPQDSIREPLKHSGGDDAVALSGGLSSHDSDSTNAGHDYAAIAGSFAGADYSGQ
ncbi:hypothetical protein CORC01_12990 [Colletotrichum orchidophilum]|uniref:Uncharacterized protein n=1 Tax=Colletotrichum orchidophilum TaxID=1209926 RepID=A0A1G4ARB2_9PEZI|nr:uncharacterized protein CORC01_12990 [Colletotrichum orchidophilum]OHE91699.1 hypothetical protein CORC01_12990 [Colletotrichum orchidophilum]